MKSMVVFVHGFYGGKNTWGKFPELLQATAECKVSSYGFDSFYIPIFGKSTSVHQLAEGLLSELKANKCFEAEDLILVGHSLGGLVIRQLLLNLEMKNTQHNITKLAFFGVPHDGSGFANLLSKLPLRCNKLKALNKDGNFVEQLNDHWSYANLSAKFDIMSVVGGKDAIVTSNSSKSIFRNHEVETNIDAGHKSLVKPKDETDLSFKLLKAFIEKKNSLTKYRNKTASTYTEWLKLDRHHGLDYVQDVQTTNNLEAITKGLGSETPLIRLTGLSGLGKSRLIMEYLRSTQSFTEDDILIYDGSDESKEILQSIDQAVGDNVSGLVIVETCSVGLHEKITKLVCQQSNLKVITLNFYHNPVNDSIHIKLDRLEQKQIIELLTNNLPKLKDFEIEKLAKFIEGFPLLADMLVKQIRENGNFDTNFTEHDLVEKLINGDGELTDKQREVLKVLSLFDYVQCEKEYYEQDNLESKLICSIAGCTEHEFGQVITKFTHKELVNRTGRFARVVPKPLALNLAMEWWNGSLFDLQSHLVSEIPEQMLESFCKQITYLDTSLNVQDFVKNFCGYGSPFGQAELLLSKQGSRLFRALVEVNPDVTTQLIYRIINDLEDDRISSIVGDVRRNFVWSLEMLVFHSSCFEKAAWCLFKLAQFENESYGNNATGQFTQLFRTQLCGTEASFEERLALLDRAVGLNDKSADAVIIQTVKSAISTHGGSRIVGAEYQGTKPEIKEWQPKTYQEIYDYWQYHLDLLIVIVKRGYFTEQVKDVFGHEIRGLIRYQIYDKLDSFIKAVIKLSDKYWPAAAQSITHALNYDDKGLESEQLKLLKSWEELLSADENNLEEKLKLIVLNPSREHVKNVDGHYIDVAAQDAKNLAESIQDVCGDLIPYLEMLLTFPEQKQSWIFAKHLALQVSGTDTDILLDNILDYLRRIQPTNTQFISGFLTGIYDKNIAKWNEVIELISTDENLVKYYPDAVRTGRFSVHDLDVFINLIKKGKLPSNSASMLTYGSVTEHLTEKEITHFCMSLSEIDTTAIWVALDNINMYMHGRKDLDLKLINPTLSHLVLNVSFRKKDKTRYSDSYHWLNSVEKLLSTEGEEFSLKLCINLINQVGNQDIDYSDLWDYVGEAFYKAFELHGRYLWPRVSDKFIDGNYQKQYRLLDLLGSGKSYRKRDKSIFDTLDVNIVIEWCKDEVALLVTCRAITMFISDGDTRSFNPLLLKLISEYGDNKAFNSEVSARFSSRSWIGSLIPYLQEDKKLIEPLIDNENMKVRSWAKLFIDNIDRKIEWETKREAEEGMLRG